MLQHESLYFSEGSSDKQYDLTIEQHGSSYRATARWGRRGQLGQSQVIYEGDDLAKAQNLVAKKRAAKVAKGYTPDESGAAYVGTELAQRDSGVSPMLLTAITTTQAESLLTDDNYVLQRKYDGTRLLVTKVDGAIQGINRRGLYIALPETVATILAPLGNGVVLDGELVGTTFNVFDIVAPQGVPFCERWQRLNEELAEIARLDVKIAHTAFTSDEKALFLNHLQADNAEGAVFRHLQGEYESNQRSRHAVKWKFWDTVTARVAAINEQRSVRLALRVLASNDSVEVGNCTIPANHDVPSVGALVEIKYLYAYPGGSLYQPQYLGERTDLTAADSTEQLKYKAGTV